MAAIAPKTSKSGSNHRSLLPHHSGTKATTCVRREQGHRVPHTSDSRHSRYSRCSVQDMVLSVLLMARLQDLWSQS